MSRKNVLSSSYSLYAHPDLTILHHASTSYSRHLPHLPNFKKDVMFLKSSLHLLLLQKHANFPTSVSSLFLVSSFNVFFVNIFHPKERPPALIISWE